MPRPARVIGEPMPGAVALGSLLPAALQRLQQAAGSLRVISRCDELPVVAGDAARVAGLIDHLLQLILAARVRQQQLFLYFLCRQGPTRQDGSAWYTLQVQTNAVPDAAWERSQAGQLQQCRRLAEALGGHFDYHPPSGGGPLFSLTLPGKTD